MSLTQPKWDRENQKLYDELFYKKSYNELIEQEQNFCKTMYHLEEFACGLDGD